MKEHEIILNGLKGKMEYERVMKNWESKRAILDDLREYLAIKSVEVSGSGSNIIWIKGRATIQLEHGWIVMYSAVNYKRTEIAPIADPNYKDKVFNAVTEY